MTDRLNPKLTARKSADEMPPDLAERDADTVSYSATDTLASNDASSLSGSEYVKWKRKQQVNLPGVINPKLLILDEATEGLSPLIQKEIWNVLATLKKSGLSIIIVDKSLEKLSTLADHFYFLVKGKIAWNGKYDQLNDKLIKSYLLI